MDFSVIFFPFGGLPPSYYCTKQFSVHGFSSLVFYQLFVAFLPDLIFGLCSILRGQEKKVRQEYEDFLFFPRIRNFNHKYIVLNFPPKSSALNNISAQSDLWTLLHSAKTGEKSQTGIWASPVFAMDIDFLWPKTSEVFYHIQS